MTKQRLLRQQLLSLLFVLVCLVGGSTNSWAEEVTFSNVPQSKTMTSTDGLITLNAGDRQQIGSTGIFNLKITSSKTSSITATNAVINSITFNVYDNKFPKQTSFYVAVGSSEATVLHSNSNNTEETLSSVLWNAGNATSLTLSVTGNNFQISSVVIDYTPNTPPTPAPTATFTYGQTVFPQEKVMDITVPAHKAGQQLTVTLSDITEGATATATGLNGNTLTFVAPAAGSASEVKVTVADNTDPSSKTVYTINVKTEQKTGLTFDAGTRYSKLIIDELYRNGFNSNITATKLAEYDGDTKKNDRTGKALELNYVTGLVAKGVIEAANYYQNETYAENWFNSIAEYGNAYYNTVPTAGGSLDDLNAVKLYCGLAELAKDGGKFANTTTYNNAMTAMDNAITGLTAHNNSYSIQAGTLVGESVVGGWFHKSDYNNQMWCDGAYMGPALLAQLNNYGKKISNEGDWNLITKQFEISWDKLWYSSDKLLYHAFEANAGSGTSSSNANSWAGLKSTSPYVFHSASYWGRADGWYFLALVDVLEQMQIAGQTSTANYTKLKGYLNELAAGIAARQDATTGCWYQLLNYNDTYSAKEYANSVSHSRTYNYLESSATAIFAAAYLKGMRLNLYTKDYSAVAKKAYKGFVENFITSDYKIYWTSRSAGLGGKGDNYVQDKKRFRDGSPAYYLKGYDVAPTKITDNGTEKDETGEITLAKGTEGKALGAFIMAAVEYERAYIDQCYVVNLTTDGNGTVKAVYKDTENEVKSGDMVPNNSTLTITATPNPGYQFDTSIDKPWGTATSLKANPLEITITDGKTFTAHFAPVTPPTISVQPEKETSYNRGASTTALTVTAVAEQGGNLSYQWYKNAVNSTVGSTAIDGATTASYTPLATKVGTTYYYCVVTETKDGIEGVVTSEFAKVTVGAPCSIESHTGTTIGATDQSTAFRDAKSATVSINPGETKRFRFTNHGNTDENYTNWNLIVANVNAEANEDESNTDTEINELVLRADNFGWGPIYNDPSFQGPANWDWNWPQFRTDMQNAEVDVTVTYNDDATMTIHAVSINSNGNTYTETENTKTLANPGAKRLYFTVDQSHITNYRELLTINAQVSNGGTLVSITENGTPIQGATANTDYFVEPDAKIVVTASCSDDTKYLKNWNVTGTQGAESTESNNGIYTIDHITANTVVKAKYEVKSNETVPAPENATCDQPGGQTVTSFTVAAFASSQANTEQFIALNLPQYATAVVKTGEGATITDGILTITAPAENGQKSVIITVTAHNGTTQADYTINFSTSSAPSYHYTVNAVDGSGNLLQKLSEGEASSAIISYPEYILSGSTLYFKPRNNSGDWYHETISPTKDDDVINLQYGGTQVSNVVFYTEGEDITGWNKANNQQRASKGQMGYGSNTEVVTLQPGTYVISARGVNGNGATRNAVFTAGDKEVFNFAITERSTDVKATSKSFVLLEETKLYVSCDGSSVSGLDWFYVQRPAVLDVTEEGQKFPFIETVTNGSKCVEINNSGSTSTTRDGIKGKFLGVKNAEKYVAVTAQGAKAFMVKAFHGNGSETRKVNIKVDNGEAVALSIEPGRLAESPIYVLTEGKHTIKITGDAANKGDAYVADVIFFTEQPKGSLTEHHGEMKVTKGSHVFTLASTSGGAITMDSEEENEYATLSLENNQLTVTPKMVGEFNVEFSIATNGSYLEGSDVYTVNIRKEQLTMTISPEGYYYNSTKGGDRPEFQQPTVTLKDEDGNNVDGLSLNYASDDVSIASVSGNVITVPDEAQGSANVTISFAGSELYEPVEGVFSVAISAGYEEKVDKNDTAPAVGGSKNVIVSETSLVDITFGGWMHQSGSENPSAAHTYVVDGKDVTDSWTAATQQSDMAPIDGYSYAISGTKDAMDEAKSKSTVYDESRTGWYKNNKPFSLPVRGSYITFEPKKNGMLTIYVVQNGAWNTEKVGGKTMIKHGQFRPHAFQIVNQSGVPVQQFAPQDFKAVTKQKVNPDYMCILDKSDLKYGDANNVGNWEEFSKYYTPNEQVKIAEAWKGGANGTQKIVTLDDGSLFAIQKGIVKYTFHAVAGQTYYMFSNFSKIGFSGVNFVEDAEAKQPTVDLVLSDTPNSYSVTNQTAPVEKVNQSQFKTITYSRSFAKDTWAPLCLPFYMTEAEVKENFGDGAQIITFDGTEDNNDGSHTYHFVYHERQNILPGYPYLIKPSKAVTGITVNNKIAYPYNAQSGLGSCVELSTSRYWNRNDATDIYRAEDSDQPYTFVGSYTGVDVLNGSLYCSTAGTIKKLNNTSGKSALKPFRSYVRLNEAVLPQHQALNIRCMVSMGGFTEFNDDVATAIEEVLIGESIYGTESVRNVHGLYNLNGQKMSGKNLPAGIYIKNGKKYNVK